MERKKGFIMSIKEALPVKALDNAMLLNKKGQIQLVRSGAQSQNQIYKFLRPSSAAEKVGPEASMHSG